jgi:hypothetical protein
MNDAGAGRQTVKRFRFTYGKDTHISCCGCHKRTRVVPGPDGEVTGREIAYFKRIHVCGPQSEPWDLRSTEGKAS